MFLSLYPNVSQFSINKPKLQLMKKIAISILILTVIFSCNSSDKEQHLTTIFEQTNGLETSTYSETITYYKKLASQNPEIYLQEFGQTDSGYPLHVVFFNTNLKQQPLQIKNSHKTTVLINNGIHPGEPDGIDACKILLRNIVQNDSLKKSLDNVIIAIIPTYNIGGALNRNSTTRANQNGPEFYGFRGNAQNYDLNRDFIKSDSKNARAFAEIFHHINPDVFIETHVSNGADYQYTLTHLFTQHNKLGNELGEFINKKMRPYIEKDLEDQGIISTPYVNVWGKTPESGFTQFMDYPRYSTGYTSLFNSLGVMIETHMLKEYTSRVTHTLTMLESLLKFSANMNPEIKTVRANALKNILSKKTYPIDYTVDRTDFSLLNFKGYEGNFIPSKVTTGKRLFYDRNKPFSKLTPYYNNFKASDSIVIPKAYILKNGWWKVVALLDANQVSYTRFKKDTSFVVTRQHIKSFETKTQAYEGHYMHYATKTTETQLEINFSKGDIYIATNQHAARYIMEVLEPRAPDSFFNWNFFDAILQQKEHFSPYVFEDYAEQFLINNPTIAKELHSKIASDSAFAKNSYAQLDFVYKQSPLYEKSHLLMPVFKLF